MPTKIQLQAQLETLETEFDDLNHEVRRLNRALNQASLDLKPMSEKLVFYPTPHIDPRSQEAITRGLNEWSDVVKDPSKRITTYIKTQQGIGWGWEKEYKKNGQFAWCGAFAAFCWQSVKLNIRQKVFPSCYRLHTNWGQSSRRLDADQMLPGDIVVVYSSARKSYGDHITICREVPDSDGNFQTVEGNAFGTLGDGTYGEGVIQRSRALSEVAHVYRLLGEDFDE